MIQSSEIRIEMKMWK